jgi:hypothetical protein
MPASRMSPLRRLCAAMGRTTRLETLDPTASGFVSAQTVRAHASRFKLLCFFFRPSRLVVYRCVWVTAHCTGSSGKPCNPMEKWRRDTTVQHVNPWLPAVGLHMLDSLPPCVLISD